MTEETRKSRLTSGVFSSTTDLWATPQDFFDKLNEEFHFNLDPCATKDNAKCAKFFTKEQDGLQQEWGGTTCFATLPMAAKSRSGSGNAMRKAASQTRWWSCSFLHGRTPRTSTTTSTTRQNFVSCVAGSSSVEHRKAHPSPAWSLSLTTKIKKI